MSWSSHRKLVIGLIVGAVLVAIIAVTAIATLYETPTCFDQKLNQDEQGIDCGGSCSLLCSASQQKLSTRFVRQLSLPAGRTDVVAYIDNPNTNAAAHDVKYRITLYGGDNIIIASKTGVTDIPPSTTVPVFVPGFYSGYQEVARAFLEFEGTTEWHRDTEERPDVSVTNIVVTEDVAPRVTAEINNPTALAIYNVPVVATLFDAQNNAIAASATVADAIPPQGSANLVFTWNAPFPAPVARAELIPILPL